MIIWKSAHQAALCILFCTRWIILLDKLLEQCLHLKQRCRFQGMCMLRGMTGVMTRLEIKKKEWSKRGYQGICKKKKKVWLMSRITSDTHSEHTLKHTYTPAEHGQGTDGRRVAPVQEVTMICIIIICSVVSCLLLCWTTCFAHWEQILEQLFCCSAAHILLKRCCDNKQKFLWWALLCLTARKP